MYCAAGRSVRESNWSNWFDPDIFAILQLAEAVSLTGTLEETAECGAGDVFSVNNSLTGHAFPGKCDQMLEIAVPDTTHGLLSDLVCLQVPDPA